MIAAFAVLALSGVAGEAAAQTDVKIALIAPLSGPYGRQGQLMRYGAEQAIEEINRGGGIKALNGAKLTLVVADAGDSIEKARNAAQRLVAQEPDIVAGTGAWLSSFSLAVTEVTERAEIPWLTLSVFRPDHLARLQICFSNVSFRRQTGAGGHSDHHEACSGADR